MRDATPLQPHPPLPCSNPRIYARTHLPLFQLRACLANQPQVRALLHGESERMRGGRLGALAVARVMAGLSSPAQPADAWRRCAEWGRSRAVDFGLLVAAAEEELAAFWQREGGDGGGSGGML